MRKWSKRNQIEEKAGTSDTRKWRNEKVEKVDSRESRTRETRKWRQSPRNCHELSNKFDTFSALYRLRDGGGSSWLGVPPPRICS